MAKHLHKRFSDEEVKTLLEKYMNEKVELSYLLETLGIKRRRFFELLRRYKKDPDNFCIQYKRKRATRKISEDVEKNIINELKKENKLIEDKEIPITFYNYSYIKDQIYQSYGQKVSLPTIIDRAKREGFYRPRQKERTSHDREILTNYIGELFRRQKRCWKVRSQGITIARFTALPGRFPIIKFPYITSNSGCIKLP